LLSATLIAGSAAGQPKDDKPAARPDANTVEVRFADDSTVKMVLRHSSIEVSTRYGKLSVPVTELRRIEFGLRIPEDTAKRIATAVSQLGGPDFKQREAASSELIGMKELAHAAVQQATKSDVPEVARRAKAALAAITESVPAEKLHLPRHDTVVAADFTIVGQVDAPTLKAITPYFGETNLKLSDVRQVRWLANMRETKVAVDAARFAGAQDAWMETGIDVRAGSALQVAASGTVDLRPGDGSTMVTGPDGLASRSGRNFPGGGGGPGGGGLGPAGGRNAARGFGASSSPGALIGRIGESGRVFVIGSKFEGTIPEDGKLYLRIVPNTNGTEASGSYDVRVSTGR
jgi:hypothetical protein